MPHLPVGPQYRIQGPSRQYRLKWTHGLVIRNPATIEYNMVRNKAIYLGVPRPRTETINRRFRKIRVYAS